MKKEDLKAEIIKVLDRLPDHVLDQLLAQLKRINPSVSTLVFPDSLTDKIIIEDADLFKRLAKWK